MSRPSVRPSALVAAIVVGGACLLSPVPAAAQTAAPAQASTGSRYDPHAVFDPTWWNEPGTTYRSGSGQPGPAYWQNRADYAVRATLEPESHTLTGEVTVTYTNESPDSLAFLWMQLDQNAFRPESRPVLATPAPPRNLTHGYVLSSVSVERGGATTQADYVVDDSRMQVRLARPLAPHGGVVKLHIAYSFEVHQGGGRMGWTQTRNGPIYDMAQWFPRMAVYDDVRGWNTLPYLGSGEFYLDYGDIDYTVTVPWNYLVVGSGTLLNPQEALTATERERLERARESDATVMIVGPDEVARPATRPRSSGTVTWRFHMDHTRDVAFAASPAFIWDAARINLPAGKHALAMSAYPVESAGDSAWSRSTEFTKASIEIFSRDWYPYPWPVAINVGGPVGGMEYPGLVFCSMRSRGAGLWSVTAHEFGHEWFPMLVGSDERRYAFMDEGFNTFIDIYASDAFNGGEFAPKRDGEYAPKGGNPAQEIVPLLADSLAPPILTYADAVPGQYRHPVEYYKPAFGLVLLREQVIGHDRFDYALRRYIHRWAYKHPTPRDFFRTIEDAAGEDLGWFWKEWFAENWSYDVAVTMVQYVDQDPSKGTMVTLENRDRMVLPVTLRVTQRDGTTHTVQVPVEAWQDGPTFKAYVPTTGPVHTVVADPDQALPDGNLANNTWRALEGG